MLCSALTGSLSYAVTDLLPVSLHFCVFTSLVVTEELTESSAFSSAKNKQHTNGSMILLTISEIGEGYFNVIEKKKKNQHIIL